MKVQLELFQSENAILQFTFSRLLYLVRSSWTSSASISITDDSPVLSRPPLVSAVSVCSINIQIKCQVRMGCGRRRLRRRGIAMPISISSFSIMPLLLVVLCSLPTSIRSRASKQDATLFFWIWVRQEPLVYWGKQIGEEFIWIARFQQDGEPTRWVL